MNLPTAKHPSASGTMPIAPGLSVVYDINALAQSGQLDANNVRRLICLLLAMQIEPSGDYAKINKMATQLSVWINAKGTI